MGYLSLKSCHETGPAGRGKNRASALARSGRLLAGVYLLVFKNPVLTFACYYCIACPNPMCRATFGALFGCPVLCKGRYVDGRCQNLQFMFNCVGKLYLLTCDRNGRSGQR